jgi:NAD-dependent deacetylase
VECCVHEAPRCAERDLRGGMSGVGVRSDREDVDTSPGCLVMGEAETQIARTVVVVYETTADPTMLERAAALMRNASRVVVLTGAGISTDSGIPDFRGPQGLWTKNPAAEKTSTLQNYLADPDVRRQSWQIRLNSPGWTAQPNAGHRAIVELERQGKLVGLVTQNIDELHQRAGNDPALVIEVHGTMWWTRCWTCADRRPMAEALDRVRTGEDDPDCLVCRAAGRRGILKSDTISFGQNLVQEVIDRAFGVSAACDLLLAVGSTLSVYPAASCVPIAARSGAGVVIVNGSPTDMDLVADAVLRGQISEILPALVGS